MSDGDVQLIPTDPQYAHLLGRHVAHDPRNRGFAALDLVRHGDRKAQTYPGRGWARRDVFDQRVGNCTMESFAGLLHMAPAVRDLAAKRAWPSYDTEDERIAAYEESKDFDPWPGRDYDGTSTDAPHKRALELGQIPSYWWLFGEAQVYEYVSLYGPCSAGTVWTDDMFHPDARGFIRYTGREVGGHEWTIIKAEGDVYGCISSWGTWGRWGNSRFLITRATMRDLLANQGDAITIGT